MGHAGAGKGASAGHADVAHPNGSLCEKTEQASSCTCLHATAASSLLADSCTRLACAAAQAHLLHGELYVSPCMHQLPPSCTSAQVPQAAALPPGAPAQLQARTHFTVTAQPSAATNAPQFPPRRNPSRRCAEQQRTAVQRQLHSLACFFIAAAAALPRPPSPSRLERRSPRFVNTRCGMPLRHLPGTYSGRDSHATGARHAAVAVSRMLRFSFRVG